MKATGHYSLYHKSSPNIGGVHDQIQLEITRSGKEEPFEPQRTISQRS
jgi:hypothetical protein